jgi:hypothetical protein
MPTNIPPICAIFHPNNAVDSVDACPTIKHPNPHKATAKLK